MTLFFSAWLSSTAFDDFAAPLLVFLDHTLAFIYVATTAAFAGLLVCSMVDLYSKMSNV